MQVHNYPNNVKTGAIAKFASSDPDASPTLSLQASQQQLHNWTLYWPHHLPELDFALSSAQSHGRGLLAIREFKLKPNVNVLQVVKDGAAQPIKVDQNGQAQAIYVDGQWVLRNKIFPTWMYGQRSELIYQKDGIVFWIVGDQRDGIGENELLRIATSLQVFHVSSAMHVGNDSTMNSVSLLDGDVTSPFTGDVLAVFPDDSNVGPYLTLVGPQSPAPSNTHVPK